jgi:hypothetical protein
MAVPTQLTMLWANLPQWFEAKEVAAAAGQEPTHKAFPQMPGLLIPKDWETCCIQMSHALNKAALPVNYSNKQRVLTDPVGNEYMLDVKEMRGYLKKYGDPDIISRVDANGNPTPRWVVQAVLSDRKGIIAFGGRHIDLWNGSKIHGEGYILGALWEAKSALSDGIFFWEVTGP